MAITGKILIVDDDPSVLAASRDLLSSRGHQTVTAESAVEGLEILEREGADLVVLDVCMPGMDGLETLGLIRQSRPKIPVIVITGRGSPETAISAAKLGAFDFQLKPFGPQEILDTIDSALSSLRLMREKSTAVAPAPPSGSPQIIGCSRQMQGVYRAIGRVASTDATVLIQGESGTGKELVAKAIYEHSPRAHRPLVVVNCVAIPETLLESELFGYERGAFTGAHGRRIGRFERATGGTIFLDEIGDISLGIQAKILRVLQDTTIERVGGNDSISVNVRLLAATNRDLGEAIQDRTFREDLYHRLNVVTIRVPPLRERREDIPELAGYFLDRFSRELEIERPILTRSAMHALLGHAWPGNVRELEHCLHRAMIFTRGYPLQADDVQSALGVESTPKAAPLSESTESMLTDIVREHLRLRTGHQAHAELLDRVERQLLVEALREARGNQSFAARVLGLPRPTLHAKLQKHGVHPRS